MEERFNTLQSELHPELPEREPFDPADLCLDTAANDSDTGSSVGANDA